MKKISTLIFLFSTLFIHAQQPLKQSLEMGVSGGVEATTWNSTSTISLSLSHHIGIGQKRMFQFYYGIRSNNIFNPNPMYDESQPSIELRQNPSSYVSADNCYIGLNYHIVGGFSIGLNSDMIGLSFGSKQDSYYNAYTDSGTMVYANKVQTKPYEFNLFMFSNSLGSLNQEFYVEYLAESKWKIRAGVSRLTTGLTASGGGLNEERKVQNNLDLFFVNVSYPLWRKE